MKAVLAYRITPKTHFGHHSSRLKTVTSYNQISYAYCIWRTINSQDEPTYCLPHGRPHLLPPLVHLSISVSDTNSSGLYGAGVGRVTHAPWPPSQSSPGAEAGQPAVSWHRAARLPHGSHAVAREARFSAPGARRRLWGAARRPAPPDLLTPAGNYKY